MKQITVSLKDSEHKALLEIMEINGINCLHKAVKMAIEDFIKHYAKSEFHHRMPDGKLVECK
jgi:hypothetical protein